MDDAKYLFVTDVADKKNIARSAHNKGTATHGGRYLGLRQENMTDRELKKMNGEVKTYNLDAPMTYTAFRGMPKDLQKEYIVKLQKRFHATDYMIADFFGVSKVMGYNIRSGLGIPSLGRGTKPISERPNFQAFDDWKRGVKPDDKQTTTVVDPLPTSVPTQPEQSKPEESPASDSQIAYSSCSSIVLSGGVKTRDCAAWIETVLNSIKGNVKVSIAITHESQQTEWR